MAIKTQEEWMTEYFRDECKCAIVDLKLSNGDSFKFGVAVDNDADDCWGDDAYTHKAGSYIYQEYNDWYSLKKEYTVTKVSNTDYLKAVNKKAYEIGESVNRDGGVILISSNNADKEENANISKFLDQYELDHEDD